MKSIKLKMIINILRGRPVAYRLHFDGPINLGIMQNALIVECQSRGES